MAFLNVYYDKEDFFEKWGKDILYHENIKLPDFNSNNLFYVDDVIKALGINNMLFKHVSAIQHINIEDNMIDIDSFKKIEDFIKYMYKEGKNNPIKKPEMVKIIHPKPEKSFKFPMIKVPKGKFTFGEEQEYKIDYDLEIGKYPVTVREFKYFVEDTGYVTDAEKNDGAFVWHLEKGWHQDRHVNWKKTDDYFIQKEDFPVVCISYNDAIEYCKWLSEKTGKSYRLPTKNEWQYACSGGNNALWSFGNNEKELDKYAWYKNNSNRQTNSVGKLLPNSWSIYDMHGLVSEWCYSDNEIGILCGGNWSDKAQYTNTTSIKTTHQSFKKYSVERKHRTLLLNEKYRKIQHLSYLNTRWYIFKEDASYQWGFRVAVSIPVGELETKQTEPNKDFSSENKKVLEIEEWLLKRYKNPNAFPITLGNFELYALEDILSEHFEDEKKDIINESIDYIQEKYGDIEWELKEQILFDKVNQRSNKLEQLINLLIPYSELEYTSDYDREDYSNPDEYPEPIYLISKDFDQYHLDNIIKDLQEDVYELEYVLRDKNFENQDYIESLLEKKYRTTYGHINEPLGIDFDCKVYEEYTEEYDNCIIYIEVSESVDLEEAWEIANTDADMIEEWFHENYEDPANSLPYISKEGGYIPIHGSLVTAEEAIMSEFEEDVSGGAFKEAIERIENEYGFMEWSPIPQNQEELDSTLANETSKDFDTHEEKTENIEQYTVCQMLGTSYFIKIILSEKDKKKMSSGYVYIDIRDYGIDAYLRYPNKKSATSYDMERFQNILNNAEKKNWEIELNCNNVELQESLGETYLTSEIFKPFNTEKEKEDYLNFLAIESEMEAWLSENYIEMEDELTYDAYEGKYKHIRGGTSDLEEILYSKFENIYPQGYVDKAIKTINQGYGDRDFTQVIYSEEDDTVPDISYFTKKYSHKIDEIVKWVFENYEDPISLTSDVLKEILVVEFQEKYSNDFIEKIIESIKLGYGNELLRNVANGGGEGN